MTRKFCLKTPYNQSKRRIYQLSAIFYFTLQSYLYNTIQSRNHRPKIRNKFLYLNTSRSLKEFWIRPDPDPEQIIPDPGKEFGSSSPTLPHHWVGICFSSCGWGGGGGGGVGLQLVPGGPRHLPPQPRPAHPLHPHHQYHRCMDHLCPYKDMLCVRPVGRVRGWPRA